MRTEWTPEQISPTEPDGPRYEARYQDGYYVVIDTTTGKIVPPDPRHYKRHRDGYLWDYAAAAFAARDLNAAPAGVVDLDREIAELQASDRDLERRHA